MIKYHGKRIAAYLLSLLSLFLLWQYDTGTLNDLLDAAKTAAQWIAMRVAEKGNIETGYAETLLIDRMHLDRTLLLAVLMLFFMLAITALLEPSKSRLIELIITIVIAHVLITASWLLFYEQTRDWYEWHEQVLKHLFDRYDWDTAETLLLKFGRVHGMFVLGEVLIVLGFLRTATFGIREEVKEDHDRSRKWEKEHGYKKPESLLGAAWRVWKHRRNAT